VKIIRKVGSGFTPSIKDALAAKPAEKQGENVVSDIHYSEYAEYSEPFTGEQLTAKWKQFVDGLSDRPNLKATLINTPEIVGNQQLLLKIESSVQEEEIRQVKFELLTWLRRELRNSHIELSTQIEKLETTRSFYSDVEKLQMMMQKNPELYTLKQKFNLDFKD